MHSAFSKSKIPYIIHAFEGLRATGHCNAVEFLILNLNCKWSTEVWRAGTSATAECQCRTLVVYRKKMIESIEGQKQVANLLIITARTVRVNNLNKRRIQAFPQATCLLSEFCKLSYLEAGNGRFLRLLPINFDEKRLDCRRDVGRCRRTLIRLSLREKLSCDVTLKLI